MLLFSNLDFICCRNSIASPLSTIYARTKNGGRFATNGFHDAYIKGISTDYVSAAASFDLEIWVGNVSAEKEEEREIYSPARLIFSDLLFCVLEPPDQYYPYYDRKPLWVDGGPWDSAPTSPSIQLPNPLPENCFVYWFFVNNWNSFIYVAAMAARLEFY